MAVHIRLSRGGTKKRPFYNIVAADSRAPRDGRFIEKLGTYNPLLAKDDNNRVSLNEDRIKHWLDVGAKPSERVALFLGVAGVSPMPIRSERPKKSAPKKKAQERIEAERKAAAEATAQPVKDAADGSPEQEQPQESESV